MSPPSLNQPTSPATSPGIEGGAGEGSSPPSGSGAKSGVLRDRRNNAEKTTTISFLKNLTLPHLLYAFKFNKFYTTI